MQNTIKAGTSTNIDLAPMLHLRNTPLEPEGPGAKYYDYIIISIIIIIIIIIIVFIIAIIIIIQAGPPSKP